MQLIKPNIDQQISKSSQSMNKKSLIIKSFPLHKKDELMSYNIYIQESADGVQKCKIMRYPCIRQGCMTTCYFDIRQKKNMNIEEIIFCLNCGNKNLRIYFDIGFKLFLQKHHKYITLNQPFNVQINPFKKEHIFPPYSLTNHITTQLSSYMSHKLFQDFRLKEAPINKQIIDFSKVRQDLSMSIAQKHQKRNYFLYSFCKYYHQPQQQPINLYIMIWLYGEQQPLKVRILKNNNKQMCDLKDYLTYGMVNFIVDLNTLVFAIPRNGRTEYFVSKVDHHFFRQQMVLKVVEMEDWKDPHSRLYASLVIDQNINSIFVIGGIDKAKNDSLEYISCFMKCRWETVQGLQLKAQIQKSHRLFGEKDNYSSFKYKNSRSQNQTFQNKFAFTKNIFMIYHYNRKTIIDQNNKFLQGKKILKRQFFSVGGAVKDPTYPSNKLKNQKPGIRIINYDPSSMENPLTYENSDNLSFCGDSYFSFQVPYNPTRSLNKFRSNIIVFGGHRGQISMTEFRNKNGQKQDPYKSDPNFNNIYLVDMTDLKYSQIIKEKFLYSHLLPQNLDQFSILLQDQKSNYYVRATLPLEKPVPMENGFIHYLVLQFQLEKSMFYFIPTLIPKINNTETVS